MIWQLITAILGLNKFFLKFHRKPTGYLIKMCIFKHIQYNIICFMPNMIILYMSLGYAWVLKIPQDSKVFLQMTDENINDDSPILW